VRCQTQELSQRKTCENQTHPSPWNHSQQASQVAHNKVSKLLPGKGMLFWGIWPLQSFKIWARRDQARSTGS